MTRKNTPEDFWKKAQKSEGCWQWLGRKNEDGYGMIKYQGHSVQAHIIAHRITKGPIPEGLEIHHTCHKRDCVNPDHLVTITHAENVALSGTHYNLLKTHCPQGHPYDESNTYNPKPNYRACKTCGRERTRKWYYSKSKHVHRNSQ